MPAIALSPSAARRRSELIARGSGTSQIASSLHLSTHTVRDHVKTIFDKVGVSSRGELVARLFADHSVPIAPSPPIGARGDKT